MHMMAKIIPQPIRGMSSDEKLKSQHDFEPFQLDLCFISRGTKQKFGGPQNVKISM